MSKLDEAVQYIRTGKRDEGRRLLEEILETDESNEQVWLWLSSVVDADEDREVCLENVLALNPNNMVARKGLEALRSGTFNVHDIMSEAIEEEADLGDAFFEEELEEAPTEDEELVMPSTMAKAKPKKAAKKKGGALNIRLIIMVGLVLLIIVILGGLAAINLLIGGEGTPVPSEGQPTQAAPGTEQPAPTATETSTPAPPTDTPTPTPTFTPKLQLPTAKPTDLPTPTSTLAVQPTPG